MTNREFFVAVSKGMLTEEVMAHATSAIAKMDEANAKRASTPSKTALANEPIKIAIKGLLAQNGAMVASAIAEALNISTSKASALCRQMVDADVLTVSDVKIPKRGKVKQYAIVETAVAVIVENDDEDDGDTNGTIQATDWEMNTMF